MNDLTPILERLAERWPTVFFFDEVWWIQDEIFYSIYAPTNPTISDLFAVIHALERLATNPALSKAPASSSTD